MPYLRRLSEFFLSIFLRFDWVPTVVAPDEPATRYIFDKDHFSEGKGVVKYAAFLPSKKTGDISVYRVKKCSEWRIWALGKHFVGRLRLDNVILCARADLPARAFVQQGLRVIAKKRPHQRHAIVNGWPGEKAGQRVKAIALARDSVLVVKPRSANINDK